MRPEANRDGTLQWHCGLLWWHLATKKRFVFQSSYVFFCLFIMIILFIWKYKTFDTCSHQQNCEYYVEPHTRVRQTLFHLVWIIVDLAYVIPCEGYSSFLNDNTLYCHNHNLIMRSPRRDIPLPDINNRPNNVYQGPCHQLISCHYKAWTNVHSIRCMMSCLY